MTHDDGAIPLRFIFHIGAGKTGTSSIQFTLREGIETLRANGVWYLGLMLEHAPVKHFPWQIFGGTDSFHSLDDAEGTRQLQIVLDDIVTRARAAKVHTLIWSSESFFDRNRKAIGPLKSLIGSGVDVQFLAYVRRHDTWVRSAYAQWGIKHKTNKGPIMPFSEWVKRRPPLFAPTLLALEADFPGRIQVRNLDAVGDAVQDCLAVCGLAPLGLKPITENVTPGDTELLMRALFNDTIEEKALPMLFERVLGKHTRFDTNPLEYLNHFMPTEADLAEVRSSCSEDRMILNKMLASSGQKPIDESPRPPKTVQISESTLLLALAKLSVLQMRRLERLESRLKALESPGAQKPAH
jgi:hypothetical protein